MSMPSKDIEPSELFVRLTSSVRPHRIVDLPRKNADGTPVGQVAMVSLTQAEMIVVSAESQRRCDAMLSVGGKKAAGVESATDLYNNIAAAEILFRACKDISDPTLKKGAFKTPHEIANAFSADEIGVLHHNYLTTKYEVGPIISTMDDDEIDAWIRLLAEGSSATFLDALSWGALTSLMISMAVRLATSLTDKSSPGSPADQTTENVASQGF